MNDPADLHARLLRVIGDNEVQPPPPPLTQTDEDILSRYALHMRTAKLSERTIGDRVELLRRLARFLPDGLLDATPDDLARFQSRFATLARATIDVYSRHVIAFYRWAFAYGHVAEIPTGRMVVVKPRRGVPHPISEADLRMLLACSQGGLRMAYVLAAFAGLRAAEITRLRAEDLSLDAAQPVALVSGKGDRERIVPILDPVAAELQAAGITRGPLARRKNGQPYTPHQLTSDSCAFMRALGIRSTLHSCRHYFASEVVKLTKDILLVRDLLGHSSVATTQIYMASSIDGASDRLANFSHSAASMVANTERTPV